jgi:hypothetical protein
MAATVVDMVDPPISLAGLTYDVGFGLPPLDQSGFKSTNQGRFYFSVTDDKVVAESLDPPLE